MQSMRERGGKKNSLNLYYSSNWCTCVCIKKHFLCSLLPDRIVLTALCVKFCHNFNDITCYKLRILMGVFKICVILNLCCLNLSYFK